MQIPVIHMYFTFVLLKKFIELLRRGTTEDRKSAINCLRTALAPCALDAYPVTYSVIFMHSQVVPS